MDQLSWILVFVAAVLLMVSGAIASGRGPAHGSHRAVAVITLLIVVGLLGWIVSLRVDLARFQKAAIPVAALVTTRAA